MPKAIQRHRRPVRVDLESVGADETLGLVGRPRDQYVRSRVASPQDNGGHERLHRDVAQALQRSPALNRRRQQRLCDQFRENFNHYRPHESIGLRTPGSVYWQSRKAFPIAPPELVYPKRVETRRVTRCGTVRYAGFQRTLSQALAGYDGGFEHLGDHRFRVWFAGLCLGDGMLPWTAALRPARTAAEQAA